MNDSGYVFSIYCIGGVFRITVKLTNEAVTNNAKFLVCPTTCVILIHAPLQKFPQS